MHFTKNKIRKDRLHCAFSLVRHHFSIFIPKRNLFNSNIQIYCCYCWLAYLVLPGVTKILIIIQPDVISNKQFCQLKIGGVNDRLINSRLSRLLKYWSTTIRHYQKRKKLSLWLIHFNTYLSVLPSSKKLSEIVGYYWLKVTKTVSNKWHRLTATSWTIWIIH